MIFFQTVNSANCLPYSNFSYRTVQNCWPFLVPRGLSSLCRGVSVVRQLLFLHACSYTSTVEALLHKLQNHMRYGCGRFTSLYKVSHLNVISLLGIFIFIFCWGPLCLFLSIVELLEELVKGSECAYSLCGLLIGSRGPVPPGSRRVFLRLLLGLEELPLAGFVKHTPLQMK